MTSETDSYTGFQTPTSAGSERNIEQLHIAAAHDECRVMMPVRIVKIYGGGEGPAPTADVQPLIDQTDGLGGNNTPHAVVYGVAVGRVHSGSGAVISDPVVGDIYMIICADRDISKLKASGQQSSPDTFRRGSLSDGVLHHAMLSPAPTEFIRFKPEGGYRIVDSAGSIVESFTNTKTLTFTPATGGKVILGGNGTDGGTYSPVMLVDGPSSVVEGKL